MGTGESRKSWPRAELRDTAAGENRRAGPRGTEGRGSRRKLDDPARGNRRAQQSARVERACSAGSRRIRERRGPELAPLAPPLDPAADESRRLPTQRHRRRTKSHSRCEDIKDGNARDASLWRFRVGGLFEAILVAKRDDSAACFISIDVRRHHGQSVWHPELNSVEVVWG